MALFHYTDINAAINILTKGELWLTHIRYLNDENELVHGMKRIANKWYKNIELEHGAQELTRKQAVRKLINSIEKFPFYVASFSKHKTGEKLSQWRAYGGDGNGCAIKFNESKLNDFVAKIVMDSGNNESQSNVARAFLCNCIYSPNEVKSKIKDIILSLPVSAPGEEVDISEALFLSAKIKDKHFKAENETRMLVTLRGWNGREGASEATKNISFRERNGIPIPYLKVRLPPDVINEIIIGPHENKLLAKAGLEQVVTKAWADGKLKDIIPITTSKIPYRNR